MHIVETSVGLDLPVAFPRIIFQRQHLDRLIATRNCNDGLLLVLRTGSEIAHVESQSNLNGPA